MIPLLVYAPVEFGAEGFMGCGSRCDHLVESCANAAAKSYWNRELPSVFFVRWVDGQRLAGHYMTKARTELSLKWL